MHRRIELETVDSTNDYLKRLGDIGENGLVVSAQEQTLGRGRLNRRWISQKGQGAWFSILLKNERINAENASGLVFVCALAAAESLRKLTDSKEILVKWPNDIVLNGKKLAGILCESGYEGEKLAWCVCGVGINLTARSFPPELPWAASVLSETSVELDQKAVIDAFLLEFDTALALLLSEGLRAVLERIRPLSATLGKTVFATGGDNCIVGKAIDFAPDGALLIDTNDTRYTVHVGDVSVRGVMGYAEDH